MPRTAQKIEDFAEQLGTLLGTAEKKARTWLGQRQQIAKTLIGVRDTASKLLSDLGHEAQRAVRRGRKAMASAKAAPMPQRRKRMSAAARKAVSIRMKKYWADRRKAKGKGA